MELIKPNVEIWEQNNSLDGIWAHVARCTRVCYQSTSKENGETNEEFVKRVILRPDSSTGRLNFDKIHGAMLEHGSVYLKGINELSKSLLVSHYSENKYSKLKCIPDNNRGITNYVVTTNLRVIYENNWLNDLEYICSPTEHHAKRITVSFITNIGVTREFNRHRVNSPSEESTRYCNYSKKNNGELNIGLPAWLLDKESQDYISSHEYTSVTEYADCIAANDDDYILKYWCDIDFYLSALTFAQWHYNMLIKKGWTAQKAREVLPLATKSQLIHTAFVDDWKHFFKLRAIGVSGAPHPNAKLVAVPLMEEFINKGLIDKSWLEEV